MRDRLRIIAAGAFAVLGYNPAVLESPKPLILIATITLPSPLAALLQHHRPAEVTLITGEYFKGALIAEAARLGSPAQVATVDGRSARQHPEYSDSRACFETALLVAREQKEKAKGGAKSVVCDFSEGTFLLRLGLLRAAEELELPGLYRAQPDELPTAVPIEEINLLSERPFFFVQTLRNAEKLINAQRFDAAHFLLGEAIRRAVGSLSQQQCVFLGLLSEFVEGLILWDRFDYRGAAAAIKDAQEAALKLGEYAPAEAVIQASSSVLKWLEQLGSGISSEYLAYDFLAAAVRQAARTEYSDALMRLYRALEARGQYEACRFFNVKATENFPTELIPSNTRFFSGHPLYKHGTRMDLGMEATFAILRAAGSEVGKRFERFYERPEAEGISLREMQSLRNNSPLAHGANVIGEPEYKASLKLMNVFLDVKKRQPWEVAPVVQISLASPQ
jgi:hypothetical protein